MHHLISIYCNNTIVISTNDFIWIIMGSGIGYFVIGYLCIRSMSNYYKRRYVFSQTVIAAVHV